LTRAAAPTCPETRPSSSGHALLVFDESSALQGPARPRPRWRLGRGPALNQTRRGVPPRHRNAPRLGRPLPCGSARDGQGRRSRGATEPPRRGRRGGLHALAASIAGERPPTAAPVSPPARRALQVRRYQRRPDGLSSTAQGDRKSAGEPGPPLGAGGRAVAPKRRSSRSAATRPRLAPRALRIRRRAQACWARWAWWSRSGRVGRGRRAGCATRASVSSRCVGRSRSG
jgi:hypothetical protein